MGNQGEVRYDFSVHSTIILWLDTMVFEGPIGQAAASGPEYEVAWTQLGTRILMN